MGAWDDGFKANMSCLFCNPYPQKSDQKSGGEGVWITWYDSVNGHDIKNWRNTFIAPFSLFLMSTWLSKSWTIGKTSLWNTILHF